MHQNKCLVYCFWLLPCPMESVENRWNMICSLPVGSYGLICSCPTDHGHCEVNLVTRVINIMAWAQLPAEHTPSQHTPSQHKVNTIQCTSSIFANIYMVITKDYVMEPRMAWGLAPIHVMFGVDTGVCMGIFALVSDSDSGEAQTPLWSELPAHLNTRSLQTWGLAIMHGMWSCYHSPWWGLATTHGI